MTIHTGGFIFGYDTGQISDILLMQDFLLRFGQCSDPSDYNTCHFPTAIEGLIVGLLSIGTLFGALIGGKFIHAFNRNVQGLIINFAYRRQPRKPFQHLPPTNSAEEMQCPWNAVFSLLESLSRSLLSMPGTKLQLVDSLRD